jgi:hypothetical protein
MLTLVIYAVMVTSLLPVSPDSQGQRNGVGAANACGLDQFAEKRAGVVGIICVDVIQKTGGTAETLDAGNVTALGIAKRGRLQCFKVSLK